MGIQLVTGFGRKMGFEGGLPFEKVQAGCIHQVNVRLSGCGDLVRVRCEVWFLLDSVQNWEQGHRRPEGPARIVLAVIAKNSKAVEEAFRDCDKRPTSAF
jgi:hypothetical protein